MTKLLIRDFIYLDIDVFDLLLPKPPADFLQKELIKLNIRLVVRDKLREDCPLLPKQQGQPITTI